MARPVFGLDVDGTIGDYYAHFSWFASEYFGKHIPVAYDGSVSFAKWMGVSKANYRKAKLAYRRSGLKRAMPVFPHAAEFSRSLRRRGALVIVTTSRPFLALEEVEQDTRIWLRRNGIQYDGLVQGERKYRDLARAFGPRVFGVMDDLPEMVLQADDASLPAILRSQPHNSGFNWKIRAHTLEQAQRIALSWLDTWEGNNR